MAWEAFRAVIIRELERYFSRPLYIAGTFGVIIFSALFFSTLLRDGLPMKVPVGIVDNDCSSLSRRFAREIESTPGVGVTEFFLSHKEAREEMQRGAIYGFIEIPEGMARDLLSNRRPKIAIYTTQSYMTAGTLAYKTFRQMATIASGAVQREYLKARGYSDEAIMNKVQPIKLDMHLIENPWSNYGVYLIDVILPGILQMVIIMMTIFAFGIELKEGTCINLLQCTKGSFALSVAGKCALHTLLFTILGFGLSTLLFKVLHYPLQCSFSAMLLNIFLLTLAAQAVGLFMIGLLPVLRIALSFGSIYSVLSLSLAGMTFPMEYMWEPFRILGELFPLRHYYLIYVHQGLLGGGAGSCLIHYGAFLLFLLLPLLVAKRLRNAMIYRDYPIK